MNRSLLCVYGRALRNNIHYEINYSYSLRLCSSYHIRPMQIQSGSIRKANGDTIIATKNFPLYSDEKGSYLLTYHKTNSDYFVSLRKAYNSSQKLTIMKGYTLALTLSNGEKVSFRTKEEFETNLLTCAGESCSITARYPINRDQLEQLTQHSIVQGKFLTTEQMWKFEPKNTKKTDKAKEGARCILTR